MFKKLNKTGKLVTKRLVIDTIGNNVAENLKSYGYKYIKSRSHIVNKFKEGYHRVILSTWDGFPYSHQQLQIHFGLRIHSVEKIVNRFYDDRFINTEFHNVTDTFSFSLETLNFDNPTFLSNSFKRCDLCKEQKKDEIFKNYPLEIFLHDTNDIDLAIKILTALMIDKAVEYFVERTDLNKLNIILKDISNNNIGFHNLRRLMQSLTLMKLLNDADFEKYCSIYTTILKPDNWAVQDSKDALNELIEYLKS